MSEEKNKRDTNPLANVTVSPKESNGTQKNPSQSIDNKGVIVNGNMNNNNFNSDGESKKISTIVIVVALVCATACFIAYLYFVK